MFYTDFETNKRAYVLFCKHAEMNNIYKCNTLNMLSQKSK